MPLLFLLLFGISLAEEEQRHSCHLLQTSSAWRKKGNLAENAMAIERELLKGLDSKTLRAMGICKANLTHEDLNRPIEEVTARSGEDGWCMFGAMGSWASGCAVSRRTRDAKGFGKLFEPFYKAYLPTKTATPVTLTFRDNQSLIVRDHYYPLDDVYCYVNGWYSLDRDQIFSNFSYLEEMSDKSCKHLEEIMPKYHKVSMQAMVDESGSDEAHLNAIVNSPEPGRVPDHVVHGMLVHAAAKCLMRGEGRGAVCDIANCAARGCLEGNELHYTQRGECKKLTD